MSNIHRTARGVTLDLDRLKTINEQTVAVGNAGVNARGDLVKGTKVIKTREQIARESYNIRGNNVAKDINVNAPIPDVILEPIESFDNPNEEELKISTLTALYEDLKAKNTAVVETTTPLSNSRIARNEVMYKPLAGLVDIAFDTKVYIKSVFGPSSPQYKQVSKLEFKSLAK